MFATYRHLANKGTILVALLALVLALFAIRPAWGQDAGPIEYAENGMDSVATFTGVDPEGPTRLLVAGAHNGHIPHRRKRRRRHR